MANPWGGGGGGGNRSGGGGFGGMRGRGMGMGPGHGHPHQMGMMGNQGGMLMGERGDSMLPIPMRDGIGRSGLYERGNLELVGPPIQRGAPPPRMISPSAGRNERTPQRTPPSNKPGFSNSNPAIRYANDCEIIVTAKAQQQYAEMIEKAIKDCQLKVDIMFPKPDVKLASFIDNIASMGTIFAVVIRPDNEAHRSVSVHVLRGPPKPEEHRNMPLTTAYQLIKERYFELKRKEVGIIPDNVKIILKYLMDDKPLTELEYATVIKFLQDRRRKQNAFEKRTNNVMDDGGIDDILNTPEAEELKEKILSILSGEHVVPKKRPSGGERIGDLIVPHPKEPLGALNSDASVQSAINNLMNPEFLSVLNSATNQGNHSQPSGRGRGGGLGRGQGQGQYGHNY